MSFGKMILTGVRWLVGTPRYIPRLVTVKTARALLPGRTTAAGSGTGPRQLLADVSVIVQSDARTGIQRVVRELLRQLIDHPPPGYIVRPVYATHWRRFRYADRYYAALMGRAPDVATTGGVVVRAGDIFLGMDLAAHNLPRYPFLLARWKASGVRFYFLVYDLLPALRPEWFTSTAVKAYREWMRTVAIFADGAVCISRSVSDELKQWLTNTYGTSVSDSISATWFHLSGEISPNDPDGGILTREETELIERLRQRQSILMVGTIEPRKGYDQVISSFETLWREGRDINLVIVGKAGWKVEGLIRKLRAHPEAGDRLVWLDSATDEMLRALYDATSGLLMASEGEGFGLPIAEAAKHGKPVLLRDIPVFREIAGANARYFSGNAPDGLAQAIRSWAALVEKGQAPVLEDMMRHTWRDSARDLLRCLAIEDGADLK